MTDRETRDTNVTTAVNSVEKGFFKQVAEAYDTTQASVSRMTMERQYRELFGDIHPDALDNPEVDMDALVRGDLDPEEVDDKYKMDGDGPAQIPVSDGGVSARPTPSSYSPTYTPQDLAQSGPELTYDDLKASVKRHWDDGPESEPLEIHEDRVRTGGDVDVAEDGSYDHDDYALRAKQMPLAKILTGILRSHGDVVTETQVEATILQYTDHQISRANTDAGKRYKKETYKELLVDELEYLVPHPDPLEDSYYTSEKAAKGLFAKEVEETITDLIDATWVLDPKEHVQRSGIAVKEDATQWLEDLADFRQKLGFLQVVRDSERWANELEDLDNDLFDEFPTPQAAVGRTFTEMLKQYLLVNEWARFATANAVLTVDDESVLEAEIFDENDDQVTVNADQPTQPMTKWVHQRENPLSPQAQIDRVSDKL